MTSQLDIGALEEKIGNEGIVISNPFFGGEKTFVVLPEGLPQEGLAPCSIHVYRHQGKVETYSRAVKNGVYRRDIEYMPGYCFISQYLLD